MKHGKKQDSVTLTEKQQTQPRNKTAFGTLDKDNKDFKGSIINIFKQLTATTFNN